MKKTIQIVPVGLLVLSFVAPVTWAAPRPPMSFFHTQKFVQISDLNQKIIESKAQAADYVQLKKKKVKHNYWSYVNTSVTGNFTNPDATISNSYTNEYYRKIPVNGLKVNNPFPFYLMNKAGDYYGFGEESWGVADHYLMSEGNLWVYYGDSLVGLENSTYTDYGIGDYRYFGFYGGTNLQQRDNPAYKIYSVTVSGNESNADATASPLTDYPALTYYYRKVPVTNLKTDNLLDYRIFRKSTNGTGFSGDRWEPVSYDYYITNSYIYIPYGSKYSTPGATFSDFYNNTDYRIFIYSKGKKKRKKLTKQYVKKYQFNVQSGASSADRTANWVDGTYVENTYYKRLNIPGMKMTDYKNIRVLKKVKFSSTFDANTWEPGNFQITDGRVWIDYGYDITDTGVPTTYHDSGSGDYRVYIYK